MVERERDTVVVNDDRSPSYGWLVALIVIGLLVLLFFLFGGPNWFNGNSGTDGGTGTDTINVDTPDNINVEPTTPTPTTDTSTGQ